MRLGGAFIAVGLLVLGAGPGRAQEPVRIEVQAVPTPVVVGFHPKNDALLLVGDGADRVRLLDFTDPAKPFVRLTLPVPAPTGFLPDGRILTGGRDGLLRVWTDTGREALPPLQVSDKAIYGMAVSPSGRLVAVQDRERTLRIVSFDSRLLPPPISIKRGKPGEAEKAEDETDCGDPEFGSSSPLFSPDERVVVFVTICGHVAAVTTDGKPVALDDADMGAVATMAFSRDGKTLIVRFVHQPGATTYVWTYEKGRFGPPALIPEPLSHREFHDIVASTGRNTFIVAAESRVQGLDAAGRATDFGFDVPGARGLAINAQGSRIAVSLEHSVLLFTADGRPLAPAPFQQFVETRGSAALPGADALVAANQDGEATLWGLDGYRIGRPVRIRPAFDDPEKARWESFEAAYAAAQGEFVIATDDGFVSVVRRDGTRVSGPVRLPGYTDDTSSRAGPAVSANAIVAIGPGEQTLRLFDRAGRPLGRPFALHGQYISALGISPDGQTIATVTSGTTGSTFQLWSAAGEKIGDPISIERALIVRRVRFSADGRAVAVLASQENGGFTVFRRGETPFIEPAGEMFLGFLADGGLARTDRGNIILEAANGSVRRRFPYHADYSLRLVVPDGLRALVSDGVATRVVALEELAKAPTRDSLWFAGEATFAAVAPGGDVRVIFREGRFVSMPLGQAARKTNLGIDSFQLGHASPDGSRIAIDDNSRQGRYLRILDEEGNALAPPIDGYYVAFPPDSSRIAVGAVEENQRSTLTVFDRNGARLWRVDLGAGAIGRLVYTHDGERIAVAVKGAIRTFDREGKPVGATIETGMPWMTDLAPTPDGGWMVLDGEDATRLLFFSAAGAQVGEPVTIPSGRAGRARYTPDGRYIFTRDDTGGLRLWTRGANGQLERHAAQIDVPYYSVDHGIVAGLFWSASRHRLAWYDAALRPIASMQLVTDGQVVVLADGRHCGAGPVFANRRAFRGAVELSAAERDALVDCAAVRTALGGH